MKYCTKCGASNPDEANFCSSCNNPFTQVSYERPAPIETGGLMAWSIITLLLCTIPGIVAIVQTCNINKCMTAAEQEKKAQSARTWCLIGTILGVLAVIGTLASGAL